MATTKRRFRQDAKTGKMKGSVPSAVAPPPTDNPWVTSEAQSETSDSAPTYNELFDVFATRQSGAPVIDIDTYPGYFLRSRHPAALEANTLMASLDARQREAVVTDQLKSIEYKLRREPGVILHAPCDEAEWREWCRLQAARVEEADPQLANAYESLGKCQPPSNIEFAYLIRSRFHAKAVTQSYDREMRYLSGYHGKDVDSIRLHVESNRVAFLGMPEAERPLTPKWFLDAVDSSYWGSDRIRKPPLDPATSWALYRTLTDKEGVSSLPQHANAEYVVFDTETTGLGPDAHIIQITAIRYSAEGTEQERISTYLQPDDPAAFQTEDAQKASAITGITQETVRNAPRFADIAPELRAMMTGRTLVAHNLMFDYPRVQRAFAAAHDEATDSPERALPLSPIVDTLRLARWVQPNPGVPRKDWKHTLEKSCERAGLPFDSTEAHDALYDVERTNDLYLHLRSAPLGQTED